MTAVSTLAFVVPLPDGFSAPGLMARLGRAVAEDGYRSLTPLGLAGTRAPRSKSGTRGRSCGRPRGWPPRPRNEVGRR